MLFSKWTLRKPNPRESALLQQERAIPAMLADILAARELTPYQIAELFDGIYEMEDPMLLPDIAPAIERIECAIDHGEHITVYGDYDCDGVTATVMLCSYLQSIGADVDYYIPARTDEGYGMNENAIDLLHARGVTLIITVDNGISAIREVAYAASLGIDVVVTDHHQIGAELPQAVAVINPHRADYQGEFKELCGAGVAFKLITAMEGGDYEQTLESFGALAAIGTVGDVVPLVSENRYLVKRGLSLIENNDLPGLRALLAVSGLSGKELDVQKVAFGISPRINAAGRIGSADLAADLLLSEDEDEAEALAQKLDEMNAARKEEEKAIFEKIQLTLAADPNLLRQRVLVIPAESVNHGVVGIVSSKIVSLYGKPNIILSVDGEEAVGSARSVEPFSLFRAISACADVLEKFGGHKMAAGLSLRTKDIPTFTKSINDYASLHYDQMPVPQLQIDRALHISDINLNAIASLEMLKPFGERNPQPIFLLKDCEILQIIPLAGGKHLKLRVNFEGQPIHLLYFKMTPESFIYPIGSKVDVVATIDLESYRGSNSISIKVRELRPASFDDRKFFNAFHYYEKLMRGEPVEAKIRAIAVPTVDELRFVYKALLKGHGTMHPIDLFYLQTIEKSMNYCKYRLCLDILQEVGLIHIPLDDSSITLNESSGKVDLEQSTIFSSLRKGTNLL